MIVFVFLIIAIISGIDSFKTFKLLDEKSNPQKYEEKRAEYLASRIPLRNYCVTAGGMTFIIVDYTDGSHGTYYTGKQYA